MTGGSKELLEIYKLHAELADRVSQRRLATNRLYVSLMVGLLLFCGALLRIDGEAAYVGPVLSLVGAVGVLLSGSWRWTIRSYQQLNSGKFKALLDLEESLSFRFFKQEWEHLGKGEKTDRYRRLSGVERSVPWTFLVVALVLTVCGAWLWVTTP